MKNIKNIKELINKISKYNIENIIISSVVLKVLNNFKKALEKDFGQKIFILDNTKNLSIKLDTEENNKIGSDIICVSNTNLDYENRLIIDMGTCNKYIVIINNVLKGIIISPGIDLKINSLYTKTALLPKIKLFKTDKIIGKNTKDCMNIGVYKSQLFEIKNFINEIKKIYPKIEKVYLTGGNSINFKDSLNDIIYEKNLLVNGLLKIFKNNII